MRFARNSWHRKAALILPLALMIPILVACGGAPAGQQAEQPTAAQAAQPTTPPEPTAAPKPTTPPQPTAAPKPPSPPEPTVHPAAPNTPEAIINGGMTEANGLAVASVKSCDQPYAGLIKEIAAVDTSTVRFT